MSSLTVQARCHCGGVRIKVRIPEQIEALSCNCSICTAAGYLHVIVPAAEFTLLTPRKRLREYRFNTGLARHFFCRTCGGKPFYVPRSNPDGYSVNLRCLDLPGNIKVSIRQFDGQNWELHGGTLKNLSTADE